MQQKTLAWLLIHKSLSSVAVHAINRTFEVLHVRLVLSHILCGGSAENFRLWIFCVDLVAKSLKTRNPTAELQGLVYFDNTTN